MCLSTKFQLFFNLHKSMAIAVSSRVFSLNKTQVKVTFFLYERMKRMSLHPLRLGTAVPVAVDQIRCLSLPGHLSGPFSCHRSHKRWLQSELRRAQRLLQAQEASQSLEAPLSHKERTKEQESVLKDSLVISKSGCPCQISLLEH